MLKAIIRKGMDFWVQQKRAKKLCSDLKKGGIRGPPLIILPVSEKGY